MLGEDVTALEWLLRYGRRKDAIQIVVGEMNWHVSVWKLWVWIVSELNWRDLFTQNVVFERGDFRKLRWIMHNATVSWRELHTSILSQLIVRDSQPVYEPIHRLS